MDMKMSEYPKLSVWSIPTSDDLQNAETIDINQGHSNDHQTKQSKSLSKPVKCWTWMSPCLQGLLLGILMNGFTLATVLALWFKPPHQTGVIITNELPPGTILLYSGNLSALVGSTHRWLLCDGSEVSRSIYSDLFSVIGVTYGFGNGNNTFNLPDFRGRFPLGSNGSQLVAGGASSHILAAAEMPMHSHNTGTLQILASGEHTHTYVDPGHNHGGSTGNGPFSVGTFAMQSSAGAGNDGGTHSHTITTDFTNITIEPTDNHTHLLQGSTGVTGARQPFDMMPPYQTINYIIRA